MDFKKIFTLFKNTVNSFLDDNVIKFSASLSYYTIFAIPPLAIIIISVCGYFYGEEAVRGELFHQIRGLVGDSAASQIQEAIKNVKMTGSSTLATIIGGATLLFGASGVFAEIQSSINYIWGFKAKPKKGILRFIINRLLSFSMVASLGFILLVSLLLNSVVNVFNDRLTYLFSDNTVYLVSIVNNVLVLIIITLLFGFIYKTLPGGKIEWNETLIGSLFTAVFFMVGKYAIGLYLSTSANTNAYGAAGSILIILVWVYYSAIILYFGAVFTKEYAKLYGDGIEPDAYSMKIIKDYEIPQNQV
ncbi:MAG: YihY/virulence factor BrkB family protein [Flavobacterium sp.]|nr:YihY/virulence factor BrkB family protein [Candidatus Neoflavobacterium equi]